MQVGLQLAFSKIKRCPIGLKPKYFAKVLLRVYELAVNATMNLMKSINGTKDPFVRHLALGCV